MPKFALTFFMFVFGVTATAFAHSGFADERTSEYKDSARHDVETDSRSLSQCASQAWNVTWQRFYLPKTDLFYDYLTSYEPGRELAHLPTADEVKRQIPNPFGYGTGMEDGMISAGVMLSLIVDRYAVTQEADLAEKADRVLTGIERCATAHGEPGFLARAICSEDLKSAYPSSSRDQYTHAVHGLWMYHQSPICSVESKKRIAKILSLIADRMIRNVTPENDYDSLRLDGSRDMRGISRMWNVKGHEAARLPMIYAAAWQATGDEKYHRLYRSYIQDAVEQSTKVETWQGTYALLQMQISLELLAELETDAALKEKMHGVMKILSDLCATRAEKADRTAKDLDLTKLCTDWRTTAGLSEKGPYRTTWYNIRESGEAALVQLTSQHEAFSAAQQKLLADAMQRLDYDRVSSCGIFYLQAAYWKARRHGLDMDR